MTAPLLPLLMLGKIFGGDDDEPGGLQDMAAPGAGRDHPLHQDPIDASESTMAIQGPSVGGASREDRIRTRAQREWGKGGSNIGRKGRFATQSTAKPGRRSLRVR